MDLSASAVLQVVAACEARRRSLPAPERAAAFLGMTTADELARSGLGIAYPAREPAAPVSVVSVDREARALREAAAVRPAELSDFIRKRAADSDAALPIAWACAKARAAGTPLAELLALLPAELPHEPQLHLAQLLRLDVVAEAGQGESAALRDTFLKTGPLLDSKANELLASRLLRALLSLIHHADRELRLQIFSWSTACMFSAASTAESLLASEPPLDALVDTILAGDDAELVNAGRALPFHRLSLHHAYLTGALLSRHPEWWPEVYQEIQSRGGDAFTPLPALLDGLSERPPDAPAPGSLAIALLELGRSGRPEVRQSALATLAGWPSPDAPALASLSTVVREREPAVRAAVAAALAGAQHTSASLGLLRRLCDDPHPAVRAAAAWSYLSRSSADSIDAGLFADIRIDLQAGSPELRRAAAMSAVCLGLGADEPLLGELLLDALTDDGTGDEGDPALFRGLERFSSPVFALALWASSPENAQRLYAGAIADNRWLLALGLIYKCDFHALPPPSPSVRESLRSRALARLGAETEIERKTAAAVLGRSEPPDSKLIDTLLGFGQPTPEMLGVLEVLAAEVQTSSPRTLKPLSDWLAPQDEPAPQELIDAALTCLGAWASPADTQLATELAARAAESSAAYTALAQLTARGRLGL